MWCSFEGEQVRCVGIVDGDEAKALVEAGRSGVFGTETHAVKMKRRPQPASRPKHVPGDLRGQSRADNSCSLKYDDVDLKLREMLVASGIEPREPMESMELAEAGTAEAGHRWRRCWSYWSTRERETARRW
jgi:hypothetical protein